MEETISAMSTFLPCGMQCCCHSISGEHGRFGMTVYLIYSSLFECYWTFFWFLYTSFYSIMKKEGAVDRK
jgi:hypothetical protein